MFITTGELNNSMDCFADIVFSKNILNTDAPAVKDTVIVEALLESSDTKIDFTIAVVFAGQVYNTVLFVVFRSIFTFLYVLAINS